MQSPTARALGRASPTNRRPGQPQVPGPGQVTQGPFPLRESVMLRWALLCAAQPRWGGDTGEERLSLGAGTQGFWEEQAPLEKLPGAQGVLTASYLSAERSVSAP